MTRRRFRSLPLFWKILVPFTALLVVVGVFGTFLIVRTLASRAQSQLDQDLFRRTLEVRASLRDRELYLLESATLAANLEGMAAAVSSADGNEVLSLARSVLALKSDLGFVAIVGRNGETITHLERSVKGVAARPRVWKTEAIVARALAEATARKHASIVAVSPRPMLAIAAPICRSGPRCTSPGAAVVAMPLSAAAEAATRASTGGSVAIYAESGELLAEAGPRRSPSSITPGPGDDIERRSGDGVAMMLAPYIVQDRTVGRIAVSVLTSPALASAREASVRLGLLLAAAMLGVVALGALISRAILAQVRPLVEVNRALGAGQLSARTPVVTDDELGELARGVNKMAEELQQSYATLEARVAERTAEVLRLLEERTDFFAAISHELRTPIAVIIAQAEMMRDATVRKTSAWTAETGKAIGDSAAQLLSLVNDILDLARAEAGRLVVAESELDLADVVEGVRSAIEGLAQAGEIDLAFDIDAPLLVMGEPARLREILLNLVDNAIKYTPPRGRISITALAAGDLVELSVADTGIGIPAEIGDRVFEPFFRVSGSEPMRGQASSGLGLALTRRLVEAHGGQISYTSDPARGTRFIVSLPLAGRRSAPARRTARRR